MVRIQFRVRTRIWVRAQDKDYNLGRITVRVKVRIAVRIRVIVSIRVRVRPTVNLRIMIWDIALLLF